MTGGKGLDLRASLLLSLKCFPCPLSDDMVQCYKAVLNLYKELGHSINESYALGSVMGPFISRHSG